MPVRYKMLSEIDPSQVEQLAVLGMDDSDIAKYVGTTIKRISGGFKRELEHGRVQIRKWQWAAAEKGDVKMQIWFGKNELGQSERSHYSGTPTPEPQLDAKVG